MLEVAASPEPVALEMSEYHLVSKDGDVVFRTDAFNDQHARALFWGMWLEYRYEEQGQLAGYFHEYDAVRV